MNKVVAFLEKYAEWLAMSFACIFLLYMVYSYIVSPDDLRVDVGSEKLMPGEVDPHINAAVAEPLMKEIGDKGSITFPVPEFQKNFALAMSEKRDRMGDEFLVGNQFRPALPGGEGPIKGPNDKKIFITDPPVPPTPVYSFSNQGNSLVSIPVAVPQGAAAPAQPQMNKVEKNWVFCEWKMDNKSLAAAWKKALYDENGQPKAPGADALLTQFLKVDVERQEMIDTGIWGPTTPVAPLAIAKVMEYPKAGDRVAEAQYLQDSEKNQVEIVEPSFYVVENGDPWLWSGMKPPVEKNPAVADTKTPFDPANPPNRELTPAEKQAVYKYNQAQKAEKEKQEGMRRKQQMDANRKSSAPSGGGGEAPPRRRAGGGYAPAPSEGRPAGQRYDDAGRPIGRPTAPGRGMERYPGQGQREGSGRGTPRFVNPNPQMANGAIQNQALMQAFDPTTLALVDNDGKDASIIIWMNDDNVTPGKTYRYRIKVSLKNPLYNTSGLTNNPKLETQYAVESQFSDWTEVKAPVNSQFFFPRLVQPIGKGNPTLNVDVFKREKGDWYQATFEKLGPGDTIGGIKNKMDFSTGKTIVDMRLDIREKDWKILISDETGNLRVVSFDEQLKDPLYQILKDKVKAAAAAGPAATADSPALINPTR